MFKRMHGNRAALYCLKLFCLSAVLWINSGRAALALDPEKGIIQYGHSIWRTEDGLPQNTVRAILQTGDGYIWFATDDGLVRFDGIRFATFDSRNTAEIKSSSIKTLCEDLNNNLWIGTDAGLIRYRNGAFNAYSTKEGLSNNNVETIYEDREGNIWIGTTSGLNRFNQDHITAYTANEGLPDNSIRTIYEDQRGNLWIGTLGGLARMSEQRFTTYTIKDGLPANNVSVIYEGRDGRLWFGTPGGLAQLKEERFIVYTTNEGLSNNFVWSIYEDRAGSLWLGTDGGLNQFKDGKFTPYTTREGLSSNSIYSIYEDRAGSLWLGTPDGLNRLMNGKITAYTARDGLSNNIVLSIYEDREGSLWVGTEAGGLNLFKDRKFTTYTTRDGLPSDIIWTVYESRDGSLWIGSQEGGLTRLKNGTLATYTAANGMAGNIVRALYEDRAGSLWIGTPAGLSQLRDGRFTTYTVADGLSSNAVWSIHEDAEGGLWIGTLGGLTRFKNGKFTVYTTEDGLSDDSVLAIQSSIDGSLWIGTRSGGLNRLKDGEFKTFAAEDGLPDNSVRSLYEDKDGALWIGTRRGGLSRFKDGRFTAYTSKEGLFDDCVFQILEDSKGNLWMSCTKGIFRVSKSELNDFAAGKINSINSISYGTADGMESRECNGGQPAGWKSKDGKLWFPTIKGVVKIDPEHLKTNEAPPPVVIEQVIADDERFDPFTKAELPAGAYRLEFQYTGLSFVAPEKIRFKYKLEGLDKDWIEAGGRRVAYYTSIPPGNYTFRVMACNNDGIWNEAGASFGFYLNPRFYQTYWFYLLLAVAVGLIGWALYRLRLRQVKSQFSTVLAERNRMAREIHDTLAQGFVGISLQLDAVGKTLKDSPQTARHHLDLAQNMVNYSLTEARRSVWDLRSQALESADLETALSETIKHLTTGTAVEAELRVTGTPRRAATSVENNLLRISQEAMANAMKHAQPKKIYVDLFFDSSQVLLRIQDDGCGFDVQSSASAAEGHFGLIGMRERAERIKGQLNLKSSPGNGTEVTVTVPLG